MNEPIGMEQDLILPIHDRRFAERGGADGLRDESLLRSAFSRPLNRISYAISDLTALATNYTRG